jgi:hypothetical protein
MEARTLAELRRAVRSALLQFQDGGMTSGCTRFRAAKLESAGLLD